MHIFDRVIVTDNNSPLKFSITTPYIGTVKAIYKEGEDVSISVRFEGLRTSDDSYRPEQLMLIQSKHLVGLDGYLKNYNINERTKINYGKKCKVISETKLHNCRIQFEDSGDKTVVTPAIFQPETKYTYKDVSTGRNIIDREKMIPYSGGFIEQNSSCSDCGNTLTKDNTDKIFYMLGRYCNNCFNEYIETCSHCNKKGFSHLVINNKRYCADCVELLFVECHICQNLHKRDKVRTMQYEGKTEIICELCYAKHVKQCPDCGELTVRTHVVHLRGGKSISVCIKCAKENYERCMGCGNYYEKSRVFYFEPRDNKMCVSCIQSNKIEFLYRKHDYKPKKFKLYKEDNNLNRRYFGFELEVETMPQEGMDSVKKTAKFLAKNNLNKYYYFKHDGSLERNFSFEFVSQPATLDYMHNNYKIKNVLDFFKQEKFSCNSGRCGLHIHIDNKKLSFNDMAKIKLFFYQNRGALSQFGAKKQNNVDRYSRYEQYTIQDYRTKRMTSYKENKYLAVNLTNYSVELRFWEATFDHLRFVSALQFSDALISYIKQSSFATLNKPGFTSFIDWLYKTPYHHLIKYFELKNILGDIPQELENQEVARDANGYRIRARNFNQAFTNTGDGTVVVDNDNAFIIRDILQNAEPAENDNLTF